MLIGHWKLDDNVATTVVEDSSGNGNDGVATQNTEDMSVSGRIDTALAFDSGEPDYIDCGEITALSGNGSFTVSLWIYPTEERLEGIVSQDWAGRRWALFHNSDNRVLFRIYYSSTSKEIYTLKESISLNEWAFVVGRYDADTKEMSIWINGVKEKYDTISSDRVEGGSIKLAIGRYYSNDYTFDGYIDDVRIYDEALSWYEINRIFTNGKYPLPVRK